MAAKKKSIEIWYYESLCFCQTSLDLDWTILAEVLNKQNKQKKEKKGPLAASFSQNDIATTSPAYLPLHLTPPLCQCLAFQLRFPVTRACVRHRTTYTELPA